jgi:hypothetical protein
LIVALSCVFTQQHPAFVRAVFKEVLDGLFRLEAADVNVDDWKRRRAH